MQIRRNLTREIPSRRAAGSVEAAHLLLAHCDSELTGGITLPHRPTREPAARDGRRSHFAQCGRADGTPRDVAARPPLKARGSIDPDSTE
jgi:hypothetical protein